MKKTNTRSPLENSEEKLEASREASVSKSQAESMAPRAAGRREMLAGSKWGRLTAVRFHSNDKRSIKWLFACDCGNEIVAHSSNVIKGKTSSCGCFRTELLLARQQTHGKSRTPEHRIWCSIKNRTTDRNRAQYRDYGGRGISVCQRWSSSFEAFLYDMGPRPTPKHSIERIDNNGNYEPGNCRWATSKEQSLNRRSNRKITWNGKTMAISEWSSLMRIPYSTLYARVTRFGWDSERSLLTPVKTQLII